MYFILLIQIVNYNDYLQHPEYSASFSAYLIFKIVTYGIPIIVGFTLSFIFKNKVIKEKSIDKVISK